MAARVPRHRIVICAGWACVEAALPSCAPVAQSLRREHSGAEILTLFAQFIALSLSGSAFTRSLLGKVVALGPFLILRAASCHDESPVSADHLRLSHHLG